MSPFIFFNLPNSSRVDPATSFPRWRTVACLLLWTTLVLLLPACSGEEVSSTADEGEVSMTIELSSPAFAQGETIPEKYTCDGEDISPPLQWQNVPEGARSLALIVDDPDAPRGDWVHWLLYNIPETAGELPENVAPAESVPGGGSQGSSSWSRVGYGGPCPPGGTHRYFFKLYALDTELDLDAGATKEALLAAMEGHILGQGELMGTYARR
jgi:Raf kinase inhibitor-like YbhB/YbcL family protein